MKKPGEGPTTEKDRRYHNQRFQQQLRREQTDEGEKRETEQHESARQKKIRAAKNFRCRTDQLQIDNKEIETAAAANRADSAGDRRQHACQDRRMEIKVCRRSMGRNRSINKIPMIKAPSSMTSQSASIPAKTQTPQPITAIMPKARMRAVY